MRKSRNREKDRLPASLYENYGLVSHPGFLVSLWQKCEQVQLSATHLGQRGARFSDYSSATTGTCSSLSTRPSLAICSICRTTFAA